MLWHDSRLTVLDLETTAADPEVARIVTIAVGYVSGGQDASIQTLVANAGVPVPDEAAAIHGWTTEKVEREGIPLEDALDIAMGVIEERPAGSPLVVFNAPYDLTVLDRECMRCGIRPLLPGVLVVDPLVLDKHLDRYRSGSRKLHAACAHYRAVLEVAHQADSDAIAAARLAWAIAKRGKVIRRVRNHSEANELKQLQAGWEAVRDDLQALHNAQRGWYAFQAKGLAAHFRRQGKPQDVPTDWPVYPARLSVF